MAISATRRPNHHDHSLPQQADRDDAHFAIVVPIILTLIGSAAEHLRSILKIEVALL
jgi:hypothetical protein